MIDLTVSEVAAVTGGRLTRGDGATVVSAVSTDSRRVRDGARFVALRGEAADGHDYVPAAVEAGAVAVLVERESEDVDVPVVVVEDAWQAIAELGGAVRARVDPIVVAVTGSVGKTTTKDLTAAALASGRRTVAAEASFNNELGVPLTLLALEPDTEVLVVEIGARGVGHIAALTPHVAPDVSIVTAVAGVHLELFGDIEAVARAKGELVEALPDDGTAVLNGDDPRVSAMAARTGATVRRYGLDAPDLDVTARDVVLDRLARPRFTAVTPWGEAVVALPVAGRHNVANALAALTVAGTLGLDLDAAATALQGAAVSDWRGEVVEVDDVVILNDAYNANPTSVTAALEMLVSVERTGRTWAVLGVMAEIGATHDEDHRRVGRVAAEQGVDEVVAVGEGAADIAAGAGAHARRVDDAEAALELLRREVGAGDVVLVKASRVGGLEQVAEGLRRHLDGEADR